MTPHLEIADRLAHAAIVSVNALAFGCPQYPEIEELLSNLRDSMPDMGDDDSLVVAPLTLVEAMSLCRGGANSLIAATVMGGEEEMPPEFAAILHQILGDLSDNLASILRREQAEKIRGLYVIIDPEVTGGREPLEIAQAAVRGGAKMLQLRDKLRDKGEILPLAEDLQALCEGNDVLLIINDHVDLAAAVGSGGVHVGQTDLPVAEARQVLAPNQVLGRSNREIDLLIESQEMGADHVAFGAIYQTTTKSGGRGPQGPERLKEARAVTKVPLVAIGGITADNVAPVIEYGADAVCVTAAVGLAPDPEAAAAGLVEAIRQAGGKV